jgi:AcrR family transcriptional regulator
MGRRAHFSSEEIIKATLRVIGSRGPAAVTISAIVKTLGCPVGSIYHRYTSIQHILAETWLSIVESFQDGFLQCLDDPDIDLGGLEAALHTPRWSRSHFLEARVLLCYRREDLVSSEWPEMVRERATRIGEDLTSGLRDYMGRRFGRPTQRDISLTRFALTSMPTAAVKPYLDSGEKIDPFIDDFVRRAYIALMKE